LCVMCGGKSTCIHKRQRAGCVECKGVSICEHSKQRGKCKACKISSNATKMDKTS
jgi:hypothetical protein